MDQTLKAALDRVAELEGDILEYQTLNDLLQVQNEELEAHNKVLRGQVRDLMMDRTYQVA